MALYSLSDVAEHKNMCDSGSKPSPKAKLDLGDKELYIDKDLCACKVTVKGDRNRDYRMNLQTTYFKCYNKGSRGTTIDGAYTLLVLKDGCPQQDEFCSKESYDKLTINSKDISENVYIVLKRPSGLSEETEVLYKNSLSVGNAVHQSIVIVIVIVIVFVSTKLVPFFFIFIVLLQRSMIKVPLEWKLH